MKFLISNDDGYFAPGIQLLAHSLCKYGKVVIVAPERDRSGASNSLTLDRPLIVRQLEPNVYYVNGTPTDCVHLALTSLLDFRPDMVFSGINHGPNLGDDTLYSGTVAAATEGFMLGIPSIAISLASQATSHLVTAAHVATKLAEHYQKFPLEQPILLNVNVPDVPIEALGKLVTTRLGRRHYAQPSIPSLSPRGETLYWIGPAGTVQDANEGTDFGAIAQRNISVTPLMLDLTAYNQLDSVSEWLHH